MGLLGWLKGSKAFPEFAPPPSEDSFRQFVEAARLDVGSLSACQAVDLMLRHYATLRAQGCSIDEDGDMLLFQWGMHDSRQADHFEFDLTRQFTVDDTDGDDGISQLSLTLLFPASEDLRRLESGNRWCHSPADLDDFRAFITGSEVYRALEDQAAATVGIGWGGV